MRTLTLAALAVLFHAGITASGAKDCGRVSDTLLGKLQDTQLTYKLAIGGEGMAELQKTLDASGLLEGNTWLEVNDANVGTVHTTTVQLNNRAQGERLNEMLEKHKGYSKLDLISPAELASPPQESPWRKWSISKEQIRRVTPDHPFFCIVHIDGRSSGKAQTDLRESGLVTDPSLMGLPEAISTSAMITGRSFLVRIGSQDDRLKFNQLMTSNFADIDRVEILPEGGKATKPKLKPAVHDWKVSDEHIQSVAPGNPLEVSIKVAGSQAKEFYERLVKSGLIEGEPWFQLPDKDLGTQQAITLTLETSSQAVELNKYLVQYPQGVASFQVLNRK